MSNHTEDEEVQHAIEVLRRGDSFDIGEYGKSEGPSDLVTMLSNPQQLMNSLNLSEYQAQNIKSLIVGGGTGAIHRALSKYVGDEVASALGGLVSGYIARRLIGK